MFDVGPWLASSCLVEEAVLEAHSCSARDSTVHRSFAGLCIVFESTCAVSLVGETVVRRNRCSRA